MNDTDDTWGRDPAVTPDSPAPSDNRAARRAGRTRAAKIAGTLILGGIAGAAILGPIATQAASPSPSASTDGSSGAAGAGSSSGQSASGPTAPDNDGPDGHGFGMGGRHEAVTDTSVVAKAIGISEADLITALQGGQTVAQVAKAHNVDLQVVIDALVADGQSELDAAVKAGTLTQAQADAEKANLVQRATDQANGSMLGGPGAPGGPGFGMGGRHEAVTDTSVVAKAIGISEADLITALQGGQTVAQVAKAHNVDLQVVIDALVADGQSELDAAVKAGTLTQAQADAEKANLVQRATDQANGSMLGGPGRH